MSLISDGLDNIENAIKEGVLPDEVSVKQSLAQLRESATAEALVELYDGLSEVLMDMAGMAETIEALRVDVNLLKYPTTGDK